MTEWPEEIRQVTDSFNSSEYLDIAHRPAPPGSMTDNKKAVPTILTRGRGESRVGAVDHGSRPVGATSITHAAHECQCAAV